jgi:uncharacterized membrane protein required for colicin V production
MTPIAGEFNLFDITVLSIVGFSTLMAFLRGFFKTVFSFFALAGSATLAFLLFAPTKAFLAPHIASKILLLVTSSGGLFITLLILFSTVNHYLLEALRDYRFGLLDRGFGFMIGFVRGVAIVGVAFYAAHMTFQTLHSGGNAEDAEPRWFSQAKTYPLLMNASEIALSLMPKDTTKQMIKIVDNVRHNIPGAMQAAPKINLMPEGLSTADNNHFRKIIMAMPEDELAAVFNEYGEQTKLSSDKRMQAYRAVVARYKEIALRGEISENDRLSENDLTALELSLNMRDESIDATGASADKNLLNKKIAPLLQPENLKAKSSGSRDEQEFDRLVETIQ